MSCSHLGPSAHFLNDGLFLLNKYWVGGILMPFVFDYKFSQPSFFVCTVKPKEFVILLIFKRFLIVLISVLVFLLQQGMLWSLCHGF